MTEVEKLGPKEGLTPKPKGLAKKMETVQENSDLNLLRSKASEVAYVVNEELGREFPKEFKNISLHIRGKKIGDEIKYYVFAGDGHYHNVTYSYEKMLKTLNVLQKICIAKGPKFFGLVDVTNGLNNLTLVGAEDKRNITTNSSWVPDEKLVYESLERDYGNLDSLIKENNKDEDLFRFALDIKGIKPEDRQIEGVCKGNGVDDECRRSIGTGRNLEFEEYIAGYMKEHEKDFVANN